MKQSNSVQNALVERVVADYQRLLAQHPDASDADLARIVRARTKPEHVKKLGVMRHE